MSPLEALSWCVENRAKVDFATGYPTVSVIEPTSFRVFKAVIVEGDPYSAFVSAVTNVATQLAAFRHRQGLPAPAGGLPNPQ